MSNQVQHTPGPWRVLAGTIIEAKAGHVAKVPAARGKKFYEDRANARLIAAAPTLLDANQHALKILQTILNAYESGESMNMPTPRTITDGIAILNAALAKARGENE